MKEKLPTSFSERAEQAAEWHVREWIRKTLCEVFLGGLQQRLIMTAEVDGNNTNNNTVHLQALGLECCLDLVRRVSDAWEHELCESKHFRTAQWVRDVWDSGRNNLWTVPLPVEGWKTSNSSATANANYQHMTRSLQSLRAVETTMVPQNRRNFDKLDDNKDAQTHAPPYIELRKLGRVTNCSVVPETTDFLSQLKYMGETGKSYWPLDYETINEMAETIPKRQRWERRTPDKESKYEVVVSRTLKSTDEDDEDQQDTGENLSSSVETTSQSAKIFAAVLRKSSSKIKYGKFPTKQRRFRPSTVVRNSDEIPRPPSNVSSSIHDVHAELTSDEKEELDRTMIHPEDDVRDENDESSFCMATIFGALQDVGTIHARTQEEKKATEGKPEVLTESQRRRQERAYIKERLAPRRIQKNQDPQKYRSKILRTEQECDDGTTKTFLELDLGWSFIEYLEEGEKRLMIFSSIQVTLEEPGSGDKGPSTTAR